MRQGYQFWEDLQSHDVREAAARIDQPQFVLIGGGPNEIPVAEAASYIHHVRSRWKRFEVVAGAAHTYPERRHLDRVVQSTVDWFTATLGLV
jgi:hypothetical protein